MSEPDRYAVLGHPVAHSRSPWIHQRFAELTGQHMVYDRLLCPLDGFVDSVRQFAAQGARGCNITVPFKFEAYALAGQRTPRAQLALAANTLRFDRSGDTAGWVADNTDGQGLVRDLIDHAQQPLRGRRLLLLGAGGAASGVLGPLLEARPELIVVANRSPDKAQALVERHAQLACELGVTINARSLAQPGCDYDVVINGTAASLGAQALPIGPQVLGENALVVDMMYGQAARGFLDWARSHGARTRDGLGMLVEQAAESFALWRGVRPPTTDVLAQLRAIVDTATAS